MIVAYVILAIVLLYIDFTLQSAGLTASMATVLLVVVLYKINKLTNLIEEEKKAREKLNSKEEGKPPKEDQEEKENL